MVGRAGEISAQLISQQLPPPAWRRAGGCPVLHGVRALEAVCGEIPLESVNPPEFVHDPAAAIYINTKAHERS